MKLSRKSLFNKRVLLFVLSFIFLVFIFIILFFNLSVNAPSPDQNKSPIIINKVLPQSATMNQLYTGNVFWGRYINDWSKASELKYAYPFSRLNEFNRISYTDWISGLECPMVSSVDTTSAQQEAALQFNCRPEYLTEAKKWFSVFTLANNHTDNQGAEGFTETQTHLEENGIQYFGNYDPTVIDDICEIISMNADVALDNGKTEKGTLPIALCGYHGVFRIPPVESLEVIKKYSDYMPVIAMPHMGAEYKTAPDQIKTSFYHDLIDYGADMVIGDHPHWVQNTESYNGHLIVYSMGNFLFDQQDTKEVIRSAAINVKINVGSTDKNMLKKWLALGATCKEYKDNCLEAIKNQNLTKLDYTFQFGAVATSDGNKIVRPADETVTTEVMQRLNWQNTMKNLQSPYSSL